jgi:uncharacterized protein with HEPN domain
MLEHMDDILEYAGNMLEYMADILEYADDMLEYMGDILEYADDMLEYMGDILEYAGDMLEHMTDILEYAGDILEYMDGLRGRDRLSGSPSWQENPRTAEVVGGVPAYGRSKTQTMIQRFFSLCQSIIHLFVISLPQV